MVNLLYAVGAITCALVVLILPARTRGSLSKSNPLDRAFIWLCDWIVLFCIADGAWGIIASDLIMNNSLLFVSSAVFHFLAAATPMVWLYFVFTYLGNIRNKQFYFGIAAVVFVAEVVLLIVNFRNHSVFYVADDGTYHSAALRQFLFYAQYANYVAIAVVSLFNLRGKSRSNYFAVLAFAAAPIVCGIFQLLYPDAPAYSIGYMLSCCIVYSFVVTEMLEARERESMQMSIVNKAKTQFLNSMSHDLRTPLNAITGFNRMALKELGKDDAKVRDSLEKVGHSSDALLTIINDILEISRIEAGKIRVTQDKGNVMLSFVSIESMMQEIAGNEGIGLEFSFGNVDDKYVICDFAHCGRVFVNLISNAIKYTERGGNVWVHCEQTGRRDDGYGIYTYTFKDNGIGMSEEFQKNLFTPFARENTSAVNNIQGTGLGLAICKELVDVMGGTISCESRQGEGSTFTVVLPFRIQDGEEYVIPENYAAVSEKFLEGRHILLVEDNELNREIASALLAEMGVEISYAEDGTVAVEIMKTSEADKLDMILMDIQMPLMNGYEATRQIRALGTVASKIPIVAMTANAYAEDRKQALEAGMNAHLAKPIDIDALKAVLKQFLS